MSINKRVLLTALIGVLCMSGSGCGGGGTGVGAAPPLEPDPRLGDRLVDVRVTLPAGVDLDLTTTTLTSHLTEQPVSATGQSQAILSGPGRVLASGLDLNDDPFLIGFVSDTETEISVASTVAASLYFALGMYSMPVEVQEFFWERVRDFPEFGATVADAEALFLEDANFFQGEAFREVMKTLLLRVEGGVHSEKLEIANNEVRSGLQLEESPGDLVKVINNLRRRCYAFVYKVGFTDDMDMETALIRDFPAENPAPRQEAAAGPVSAYDSFIGTLQSAASGKGIEFFRTESKPLDVTLGTAEKQAEYRVRVIGPSATPAALTATEEAKLRELELDTLAQDVVLPILFKLAGQDDFLKELKTSADLEALAKLTHTALSKISTVIDPISEGKFEVAARGLLDGILDGTLGAAFEPIYNATTEYIGKRRGLQGDEFEAFKKRADRFNLLLRITDTILEINKYRELIISVFQADMLEEFEVVTSRSKVTLLPQSAVVIQGEGVTLTAEVQDPSLNGAAFEYTWSTSGQYGELRDSLGKSGMSFVSSQKQVEFFSSASVSLPAGVQAIDVVNVKVAVKLGATTTPVGERSAAVQVRELGFEIVPGNAELQGGESLVLRLQRTDGQDPFASAFFDYKVVWATQGAFGLFDAATTNVTSTTSNTAVYTCLEEEDEGVEGVAARIYCRPKGSVEPYEFVDRVGDDITILNDPNIKILYVPRFTHVKNVGQDTPYYSIRHAFRVPRVEGAERYEMEIVMWGGFVVDFLGRRTSWLASNSGMLDETDDSRFIWFPSGGTQTGEERVGEKIAIYNATTGMAKVRVTLAR